MKKSVSVFGCALLVSFAAAAGVANAAESKSDLFVLSANSGGKTISYDNARKIRICVDSGTDTSLKVEHGLGTNVVHPGDCYTFQTQEFRVSAKGLKPNYQIVGRVDTLD